MNNLIYLFFCHFLIFSYYQFVSDYISHKIYITRKTNYTWGQINAIRLCYYGLQFIHMTIFSVDIYYLSIWYCFLFLLLFFILFLKYPSFSTQSLILELVYFILKSLDKFITIDIILNNKWFFYYSSIKQIPFLITDIKTWYRLQMVNFDKDAKLETFLLTYNEKKTIQKMKRYFFNLQKQTLKSYIMNKEENKIKILHEEIESSLSENNNLENNTWEQQCLTLQNKNNTYLNKYIENNDEILKNQIEEYNKNLDGLLTIIRSNNDSPLSIYTTDPKLKYDLLEDLKNIPQENILDFFELNIPQAYSYQKHYIRMEEEHNKYRCSICLFDIEKNSSVYLLGCFPDHVCHIQCFVDCWLEKSLVQQKIITCSLCKQTILFTFEHKNYDINEYKRRKNNKPKSQNEISQNEISHNTFSRADIFNEEEQIFNDLNRILGRLNILEKITLIVNQILTHPEEFKLIAAKVVRDICIL